MTSEEYGQILDDFELDKKLGLISEDFDLTKYIEQRRREFESKADGGSIGIEVLFTDKKPRKNFFMGGPALTGTALDIYNSMKAYGFPDEDIANALRARGLYDTTPTPTDPAKPLQPNITRPNGGGRDENDKPGLKNTSSIFGGLNIEDPEAEAYGIGPTFGGTFARMKQGLGNMFTTFKNIPTPFNIALKTIENIRDPYKGAFGGLNKATRDAIAKDIARDKQGDISVVDLRAEIQDMARGGQGSGHAGGAAAAAGAAAQAADDEAAGRGGYDRGGLATMFTRRR